MGKGLTWSQAVIHAIEWRIYAIIIDFVVVYAFTGKVVLSLAVSSVSALVRTLAHALWVKIKFRRFSGQIY